MARRLAFHEVGRQRDDARRTGCDPPGGVHSIQIEINRRLYLDEPYATKTGRFLILRADLDRFTRRLADVARHAPS